MGMKNNSKDGPTDDDYDQFLKIGGCWCLWAGVGDYRRMLVPIGGSWCLWAGVGVYRRVLVIIGGCWCL